MTRHGPSADRASAPVAGHGQARHGALPLAAALAALLLPGASAAFDQTCRFDVECYGTEPCAETDFALRLRPGPDARSVRIADPAGEIVGQIAPFPDAGYAGAPEPTVIGAQTPATRQVLMLLPDGVASYTLHMTDGSAVIRYSGRCEDHE
jgi:hypothetical protein